MMGNCILRTRRRFIMFRFCFIFLFSLVKFGTGSFGKTPSYDLPTWITENSGFKDPMHINSVQIGHGSINEKKPGTKGWLVFLNEKKGHGIEIELHKLCLEPASEDFLMLAPWPMRIKFKEVKLFTGNFSQTLKVQIPNTKAFFLLFNASSAGVSKEMSLNYRRYGPSLEVDPPSTESPVKKNTVYEVQLKGRRPEDYSDESFMQKMKQALRAIARRYSLAKNISFNNDIPTEEMVRIHKISFCPFEWPERDICASIRHSIFVSGTVISEDQIIMDYELTAERLTEMWRGDLPELEKLEITVFVLPGTAKTTLYWLLITGIIITGSLLASFVFWKADKHIEGSGPREKSVVIEEIKKKPKLRLGKHQRIPSFMYDSKKLKYPVEKNDEQTLGRFKGESLAKPKSENFLKLDSTSDLPIKNYYGSFLFGSNTAFEDDEGNTASNS